MSNRTDNSDEIYIHFRVDQYLQFAESIRELLPRTMYTETMQRPREAELFMTAGSYEKRIRDARQE